jgi:hypothetical protein
MLNPYTPPAMQGIMDASPQGYIDVPFDYVYNQTLAPSITLNNEVVSIFTEADFAWRGLIFTATGLFSVYPAGGRISLNITELSGGTNVVQLLFVGVNRYQIGSRPTVRR